MSELDIELEMMQRRVDKAERRWHDATRRVHDLKECGAGQSKITAAVKKQMRCEKVVFDAWYDQITLFSHFGPEQHPGEPAHADADLEHLAWLSNAT